MQWSLKTRPYKPTPCTILWHKDFCWYESSAKRKANREGMVSNKQVCHSCTNCWFDCFCAMIFKPILSPNRQQTCMNQKHHLCFSPTPHRKIHAHISRMFFAIPWWHPRFSAACCSSSVVINPNFQKIPISFCKTAQHIPSLKLTVCTWRWMIGRRSFPLGVWPGLFSGANC